MNKFQFSALALALAAVLGACSSAPVTTSFLDQTRDDFRAAQANPKVARYAALEMGQAGDALAKANTASSDHASLETIDKLAYLARQKIALTQELAKQRSAEAEVGAAEKERDQMRLEQRTVEADQAKMKAANARIQAQIAGDEAAAAQQKAQISAQETVNAQRQVAQAQQRTAQLEAQLATLAAKKTERGLVITLGDVLFGTDLSRLNSDGMRTAQKLADFLREYPQRTVLVEGFTDSTGAATYNQDLSERRANAVSSALQELGIARDRIATKGYGEAFPIAANSSSTERHLNRRVEIVLSDENGKVSPR